ncbi:maleylpyruvate isomerase family mycothiol-dependent enzyme [Nocardioides cynanchi]|uniref:maleylpyruvate isomerase family mycothiol-dependent enzyme n=1 Tax=Nocardioides cynanchi TaxID=2558918 RepID=UPI0012494A9D|nr:maleylpyruvate isomerase family mycothiol-dependent enzyme [Nocardioides cynanchi]
MSELSTSREALDLLHASHARLAAALGDLSAEQARAQSYDDDWNVGQVASHLGSGADVFRLMLDAGLAGGDAPGVEAMQPIWDEWNAKEPGVQVRDVVVADAAFLARIEAIDDATRDGWKLDLFGAERDLGDFLQMRLSEHTLHTWDIVVAFDPTARLADDAAAVVLGNLAMIAGYTGQKRDEPLSVEVRTTRPERAFHLDIGPGGAALSPSYDDTAANAVLELPAEAFVRLVYGRLDPDHTPESVVAEGVDLDLLRATFPGV